MWSAFMDGVLDSGLQGVLIGAGIALVGSFFATWYADHRRERVQERETLSLLVLLLTTLSELSRQLLRDEFKYEPVWVRMLRRFEREHDVLERNRDRLVHIRNANLRVEIAELAIRLGLVTDGMIADAQTITALEETLETASDTDRERLQKKLDRQWGYRTNREQFFLHEVDVLTKLMKRLEKLA